MLHDTSFQVEGKNITWQVSNNFNADRANSEKIDTLHFFRTKMQQPDIIITVVVNEESAPEQMPYTSKEKYDYLVKINPALADFKSKLGLDFS